MTARKYLTIEEAEKLSAKTILLQTGMIEDRMKNIIATNGLIWTSIILSCINFVLGQPVLGLIWLLTLFIVLIIGGRS